MRNHLIRYHFFIYFYIYQIARTRTATQLTRFYPYLIIIDGYNGNVSGGAGLVEVHAGRTRRAHGRTAGGGAGRRRRRRDDRRTHHRSCRHQAVNFCCFLPYYLLMRYTCRELK